MYEWMNNRWLMMNESPRRILGSGSGCGSGLEKSGSAIDEVNLLLPILFTVILLSKKWSEQINLGKSTENSSGHKLLHLAATMSFFGLKKDALLLFELFLQESMLQLLLTGIMQVTSSEIVTKHYKLMIFYCAENLMVMSPPPKPLYIYPIFKSHYTEFDIYV